MYLIFCREAVDGGRFIAVSGIEDRGGKIWLVRAVWVVLSFETETAAVDVRLARFPFETTV